MLWLIQFAFLEKCSERKGSGGKLLLVAMARSDIEVVRIFLVVCRLLVDI